jgi:hypothetical protein
MNDPVWGSIQKQAVCYTLEVLIDLSMADPNETANCGKKLHGMSIMSASLLSD